jgi:hypothetical protein
MDSQPPPEINQAQLMEQVAGIFEQVAENPNSPTQLYDLFSMISTILFEYKTALESGQTTGWADKIQLADGSVAFQGHEARTLETLMEPLADPIKSMFAPPPEVSISQYGGALPVTAAKALGSKFKTQQDVVAKKMIDSLKGQENMSLDYIVEQVAAYLDNLNQRSRTIAESVGILKLEKTVPTIPIPTPFTPIPLQVPTRFIILLLQGILEFIRITFSFSDSKGATLARIFGSFGAALIDAGKGDWKSAIFSIVGIFSSKMAIMGAVGKLFVKVFSFISDDVSSTLGWAMYDSTKSWVAGIWIFVFSVFAPAAIRDHVNSSLAGLNTVLEGIDVQIQGAVNKISTNPKFSCYTVSPNTDFKAIDFTSLDRLQALLGNPAFHCSAEVVKIINSLSTNPPARIILELIGLPTTPKGLERSCKGNLGKPADMSVLLEDITFKVDKKGDEACVGVEASAKDLIAALKQELTGKPPMIP